MILALVGPALAATLSGLVAGEDGTPVGGVMVVAYDVRLNYATATTSTDGTWMMRSLPAGRYRLRALPADDEPWVDRFGPAAWDFCDADVLELAETDVAEAAPFSLPVGGSLAGRLLDEAGSPLAGVEVLVTGASERTQYISRLTTTDADGRFLAVGLDADAGGTEPYVVEVGVEGRPDQFLGATYNEDDATVYDVGLDEVVDALDHTLLDGIHVSGVVSGPGGPVASGAVYVYSSSQVVDGDIAADGTFAASGLPPGDVIFWASSDGLATTYYPDPADPDAVGDRPGGSIPVPDEDGVCTTADLSLPEESTITLVFEGEGDLSEVGVLLYNDTMTVGRGGSLAEDGTFTIDALYDGDYALYVYGDDIGYVNDWHRGEDGQPAVLRVEGDTTFVGELIPEGRLAGTVVDDEGAPVYGAYLYATDEAGTARTDASASDGTWAIGGLVASDVRLKASYSPACAEDPDYVTTWHDGARHEDAAGWLAVDEGVTQDDLEIVLPRDFDHDDMGDAWEREHGLDDGRDDADEDADGDGYTNLDEWLLGTSPTDASDVPGGRRCGCGDGGSSAALLVFLPFLLRRRRA